MSDIDDRLQALWRATDAPARDMAFVLAVEARLDRRLMLVDVAGQIAASAAAVAALVGLAPAFWAGATAVVGSLDAAGPALAAVAAIGAVMMRLSQAPAEA